MPPRTRRFSIESGFTILEVLVAFVLLAMTLAALMQVFSGGLREAQVADEYARAALFARSHLAAVTATERVEEGSTSGSEDGFAWTVVVSPYDERLENPDVDRNKDYGVRVRLVKVESVVAWHAADGRDRDLRLATLLLQGKL